MKWMKLAELSPVNPEREVWQRDDAGVTENFPITLYLGKKTDLLALKSTIVTCIADQVAYYQSTRRSLYQGDLDPVVTCPVCQAGIEKARAVLNVYGAQYVQCTQCTHVYVKYRPTGKAISDFYLNDVTYAATYTDRPSAEKRLEAIAVPWVKWMCDVYERSYGRKPRRVLDVGSGAGHFVEACRRFGIQAEGVELSQSSREFARKVWGFELDGRNFLEVGNDYAGFDIVTFWGLLEHTPNPSAVLACAAHVIKSSPTGGMIISKLPRWDSLSSAIQTVCNDTVIRHLDPMGHIMAFSDASAAELYYQNGLRPVAAWYYGMDVYETLMQMGISIGSFSYLTETGAIQRELQQAVDVMRGSDGLVLVGRP